MNQTEKIFNLFTGKIKDKPVFEKPFEINGKVYATEYHKLIRIDKSLIDFELQPPAGDVPSCEAVIPVPNISIPITYNLQAFEALKTEDEFKEVGEYIDCKTCDGHGVVDWEFEHYTKEDDCPVCDGNGYASKPKKVPTGQKTFGTSYVKCGVSYFMANLFYSIIEVAEITQKPIFLIGQPGEKKASLFKVGDFEILLMPCDMTFVNKHEVQILTILP